MSAASPNKSSTVCEASCPFSTGELLPSPSSSPPPSPPPFPLSLPSPPRGDAMGDAIGASGVLPALPDSLSDSELKRGRREGGREREEKEQRERRENRKGGERGRGGGGGEGGREGKWVRTYSEFYKVGCMSEADCYSSYASVSLVTCYQVVKYRTLLPS